MRPRRSTRVALAAALIIAWYILREPTRPRYLANVIRQARHLPDRYSV